MDNDHHDYEKTSVFVRQRNAMRLRTEHSHGSNNHDSSSSSNDDERIRRTVRSKLHEDSLHYSLQLSTPLRSAAAAFPRRKRTLPETGGRLPTSHATSAATDSSSENVVTADTITTSDDRYSSGGDGTVNATTSVEGGGEPESSGHDSGTNSCTSRELVAGMDDNTKFQLSTLHSYQHGPQHYHHRHHHFHHRHYDKLCGRNTDDGSALQVPGDDGSKRLDAGNVAGILQPATVMASRYTPSMSGGSGEGEFDIQPQMHLLPPHREPGHHTIRKTVNQFPSSRKRFKAKTKQMKRARSQHSAGSTTDSSTSTQETVVDHIKKRIEKSPMTKYLGSSDTDEHEENGGGSSSGSGTEGGYAGSASSNETRRPQVSCSSLSMSSSEGSDTGGKRKRLKTQRSDDTSSSSDIADFSSGSSETGDEDGVRPDDFDLKSFPDSSSNDGAADDLEESYLSAKRAADEEYECMLQAITRKRKTPKSETSIPMLNNAIEPLTARKTRRLTARNFIGRPPILSVGSDIMAHVLTFLQPPEILDVLTMPLSKGWQQNFTRQPELWRVLCLVEPFKANVDENSSSSDDDGNSNDDTASSSGDSFCSVKNSNAFEKNRLDKFRGLYTSFVRCMKYLSQIRDDALNGRPPTYIDYGYSGATPVLSTAVDRKGSSSPPPHTIASKNKNLQNFLANARGVVIKSRGNTDNDSSDCDMNVPKLHSVARVATVSRKRKGKEKKKPIFGPSMITGRLLGPTAGGEPGNMNLPWSCALYSIVNWMVAYTEVEGIQTLCLKVLPCILEDEQQRLTAQTARLTNVVLRAMVMFPDSEQLHIAAFHSIVLLARPHGGREGMLFHSSMTAAGIFGVNGQHGRSGIAVMLDSMLRFQDSPLLLAMSCWALVNIALAPEQKAALVKLGGIQAAINAMQRHPFSAEVQFRALFALINLVIPSVREEDRNENAVGNGEGGQARAIAAHLVPIAAAPVEIEEETCEVYETTEKEITDGLVGEISSLVVRAMKNFCSSEAILNRACLVLHNLSLTEDYHSTLLWTPQCYQMLEWCIANYRTDQVLQQSASGTLHRLKLTLSHNEELRKRFSKSLQKQQQVALEQAQKEARRLNEQQEALLANAREAAAAAEPNGDPIFCHD